MKIEEVNGDVWVRWRQLGADGGSGGGQQSKAAGGRLLSLERAMFWGSEVRRQGVLSNLFFC